RAGSSVLNPAAPPYRHGPRPNLPRGRGATPSIERRWAPGARFSTLPLHHHLLYLGDRLGWIQVLGAHVRAVHDGVTAIQAEGIFQLVEPRASGLVATIDDPPVRSQQSGGSEEAIAVPPVAGAGRGAAGTQNARRGPVNLLLLLFRLQ